MIRYKSSESNPISIQEMEERKLMPIGYAALCSKYGIQPIKNIECNVIADGWGDYRKSEIGLRKVLSKNIDQTQCSKMDIVDHLIYATANEDLNLYILKKSFESMGSRDEHKLMKIMQKAPPSNAGFRKLGYLYETLTGKTLPFDIEADSKRRLEPLLDAEKFYTAESGAGGRTLASMGRVNLKYRVADNSLGDIKTICPTVYRTESLGRLSMRQYGNEMNQVFKQMPTELQGEFSERLFQNESLTSFRLEHDGSDPHRVELYRDILLEYKNGIPQLNKKFLVYVQNAIVDKDDVNYGYRTIQNFVGIKPSDEKKAKISYIPPQAEDVPNMMDGIMSMHVLLKSCDIDPVIAGSVMHGAFVAVHPFTDGNGRISRLLLHDMLAQHKYKFDDTIFPISDVIVNKRITYERGLDSMLYGIMQRCDSSFADDTLQVQGNEPDLYRYLDMTPFAECIYSIMARTIDDSVPRMINEAQFSICAKKALLRVPGVTKDRAKLYVDALLAEELTGEKTSKILGEPSSTERFKKVEKGIRNLYETYMTYEDSDMEESSEETDFER